MGYNIIMREYTDSLDFAADLAKICVEAGYDWRTSMRTAVFMLAFVYGLSYLDVYKDIKEKMNEQV